jgi:hypothetical protein
MQLGFDAHRVITLRMMRLATGGAAARNETQRMIVEKVAAIGEAQAVAVSGVATGQKNDVVAGKVLSVFRKRVRANKQRLSRHKK